MQPCRKDSLDELHDSTSSFGRDRLRDSGGCWRFGTLYIGSNNCSVHGETERNSFRSRSSASVDTSRRNPRCRLGPVTDSTSSMDGSVQLATVATWPGHDDMRP